MSAPSNSSYPAITIHKVRHIREAFRWIVHILRKHRVRFEITGGFAAELYGSRRPLADIDFDISEKDFLRLIPALQRYIVFGPRFYRDLNWRLFLMTLKYRNQLIDLAGIEHTKIFDHTKKRWVPLRNNLFRHTFRYLHGMKVPITTHRELLTYKKSCGEG